MISVDEHAKIREFANGSSYHTDLRGTMEAIYQNELRHHASRPLNNRGPVLYCVAMKFLSEVFAPVPDLYLRRQYRKKVASGEGHLP